MLKAIYANVITWIGILVAIATLFENIEKALKLAPWARALVEAWQSWQFQLLAGIARTTGIVIWPGNIVLLAYFASIGAIAYASRAQSLPLIVTDPRATTDDKKLAACDMIQ